VKVFGVQICQEGTAVKPDTSPPSSMVSGSARALLSPLFRRGKEQATAPSGSRFPSPFLVLKLPCESLVGTGNLAHKGRTHATGQTYPRFSREALDGEGVCFQLNHSQRSPGGLGLTVNQRGTSK
jgi:hypothetical protein